MCVLSPQHFVSERKYDEDLGKALRFTFDLEPLKTSISGFGSGTSALQLDEQVRKWRLARGRTFMLCPENDNNACLKKRKQPKSYQDPVEFDVG